MTLLKTRRPLPGPAARRLCRHGPARSVEGPGNAAAWKVHRSQVETLDGWQISGKIGIRAPQESGSGTLFWLQRQEYFDIRLSGPLGRGAADRPTGRRFTGSGRPRPLRADSPEALVEAQLGWQLPVSHLLGGFAACPHRTAAAA